MVWFPNAKINLGLGVLGKRSDGYHNLSTCFYPIPFCDALEFIPRPNFNADTYSFSGLAIPGSASQNLCARAIALIRQNRDIPFLEVHLHKAIPMGAGLGGGSSDAAFVLVKLNDLFELGFNQETLAHLALQLGSDCPFFIQNLPAIAGGRGENLSPIDLSLGGDYIVVLSPDLAISTAAAFAHVHISENEVNPDWLTYSKRFSWKDCLFNDFESFAFEAFPLLKELKTALYDAGAYYAAMSGSGSSIFGLFEKQPNNIQVKEGVRVFQAKLPAISVL